MYERELKNLLSRQEYEVFLEFMISHNYMWIGGENDYCFPMYIQEFISTIDDEKRKERIIEMCIKDYPQVLGYERENL